MFCLPLDNLHVNPLYPLLKQGKASVQGVEESDREMSEATSASPNSTILDLEVFLSRTIAAFHNRTELLKGFRASHVDQIFEKILAKRSPKKTKGDIWGTTSHLSTDTEIRFSYTTCTVHGKCHILLEPR